MAKGKTNVILSPGGRAQLHYRMLFDAGDPCTAVTGGFVPGTRDGSCDLSHAIALNVPMVSSASHARAVTAQPVSVAGYTALCARVTAVRSHENFLTAIYTAPGLLNYGLDRYTAPGVSYELSPLMSRYALVYQTGLHSLSLAGLTEDQYVYVSAGNDTGLTVTHLWQIQQDDWQRVCTEAGLNPGDYADEAALCSQTAAVSTLLSRRRLARMLCRSCTGTLLYAFCRSAAARNALAQSPFAAEVYANPHWNRFLTLTA